jgi:mRNA interferase RelE/StbE
MPYAVGVTRRANKELARLPAQMQERIDAALDALAADPRPPGTRKLTSGAYRVHVGDYRVLFDVDDDAQTINILRVGHRREVYKDL